MEQLFYLLGSIFSLYVLYQILKSIFHAIEHKTKSVDKEEKHQ